MISIQYQGRLGNNMIQYFAGRVLSDKFNFYLNTKPRNIGNNWGSFFNISPPKGNIKGSGFIEINDFNFIEYLSKDALPPKHYVLNGFFQTSSFLHKYAETIKNYLHIKYIPQTLNKIFVAYRIGDMNGLRQMLPKEYYEEALNSLNHDGGYITSDTLDHPFIK